MRLEHLPRSFSSRAAAFSCVGLLALLGGSTAATADESAWRAGAADVVITPEKNIWMAGYASRDHPAEGKETDLHGKALALEDAQGARLVIVTLDLIGVPLELREGLERRCGEAYKLPPEGLLLNASHTHSGPEFRVGRSSGYGGDLNRTKDGEDYGRWLEDQLFEVIGKAIDKLEPAKLGYSYARAGFAMNRRLPTPSGFRNSPNPDGAVDQDVPVLTVKGEDGELRAVVFGYACHNTTLALYDWNADYAGYAQEYIQESHPGALALFMMGCGGDQNPYPRGTVELCKQHGRALANAVEVALGVAPKVIQGPLRSIYAKVDLDYSPIPTREEFEKRLESSNRVEAGHAKRFLAKLDAGETLPTSYPCPVQVVRFGDDLILAAIGGETLVEYSLRLKRELAGSPAAVWVAGYSNDVMGYVPCKRVREEGGYEAADAMLYSSVHPAPWDPSLEDRIISKILELNQALQSAEASATP